MSDAVEALAQRIAERVAETLRLDRGIVLAPVDVERAAGAVELELAKSIMRPDEAAAEIRAAFRRGLAPDEEGGT